MAGIKKGAFDVPNPYNGRIRHVAAASDTVHTIAFWSKNYGPFMDRGHGKTLQKMGFNLFFNFTINSETPHLEPHVPPLARRLNQLEALADEFGPDCISWRFDPICRYETTPGQPRDNLDDFSRIAAQAQRCGITRCITSFMDPYPKIRKRTARLPNFSFLTIPVETQRSILLALHRQLESLGICLSTCCEKELQESLPPSAGIAPSACIPNDLLMHLYGGRLSMKRDSGQRRSAGCGCKVSVDIGAYANHPCFHNCLFCYANPCSPPENQTQSRVLSHRGRQ